MRTSPAWLAVLAFACGGRFASDETIGPAKLELALAARSLTATESRKVDEVGFAILAQGEARGFHLGYTALFHAHQPVYVTADSLLYAWHSSYDAILMGLEREHMIPTVTAMLADLRAELAKRDADSLARADVDAYLAVAAGLLTGKAEPVAGADPTAIATILAQAQRASGSGLELFGQPMKLDFSMFQPRGHYTYSPDLEHYFRAMTWLGRVELRLAGRRDATSPWHVDHRALRAAMLLGSLFTDKTRASWRAMDATLAAFVGPADSMSLPGLAAGLAALPADVDRAADDAIVAAFRDRAAQKIRTQLAHAGQASIAFVMLGQRFVADSQVFSDLTYGSLETKPPRLMPTPLDIAYTVFANPAARQLLAPELDTYGKPYATALDAARVKPEDALWTGSLYHLWLVALRGLSPDPKRDASLPAPLASDAWARRMLGAQLASWAELRHDNLLYAKQSMTAELGCEYPDAYVDPYPAFYAGMEALAAKGRATIQALPFHGVNDTQMLAYFDHLKTTMMRLRKIAVSERANQPLTDDDLDFINHMVSVDGRSGGCTITYEAKGWYAELFYERSKALQHDPVIADVHTQPTDELGNSVGRVLHVGTGFPRMLVVALQHDRGDHAQTYRGFVSSYAETVTQDYHRMTDEEWRDKVYKAMPGAPPWLTGVIAP